MLGYRTVLTADRTQENLDGILTVLKHWVTKKGFPSMPTNGTVENRSGAKLTASSYSTDTSTGLRWELVEDWDPPKWAGLVSSTRTAVLHITLVVADGRLWFWVDIEPPTLTLKDTAGELKEEVQYTGTPGFMSKILEEVEMRDGLAEPMSGFQALPKASYVSQLIDVVEDETRLGAVFVTSPPSGVSVDEWIDKSNRRSYAMQGLAVGYVLSPDALMEFNRQTRLGHSVPPGGMRTFVPGARLFDPDDSVNHRLMLPSTLRDSDERRVRRILRNAQIRRLRGIRLPEALRYADYEFLRKRRMQPFEVLHQLDHAHEGPAAPTDVEELDSATEIADLRRRLADAEDMAHEALRDIDRFQRERDEALEFATQKEVEADVTQLEANESYSLYSRESRANEKLRKRIEYLQGELVRAGAATVAWAEPDEDPSEPYPETFSKLVDRLGDLNGEGQLPGVRFSGNRDLARELDEHSMLGEAAVVKVWDALLTFAAYTRARETGSFDGSLSNYTQSSVHGGLVRIGKVVWSEGKTTKSGKLGAQRMFPVDERVDASGQRQMVYHVKLSNLTGVAPRMYFDDTYSTVGYVTVGYLGSHLDNTLTN